MAPILVFFLKKLIKHQTLNSWPGVLKTLIKGPRLLAEAYEVHLSAPRLAEIGGRVISKTYR
jgi:hypothetical protein